METSIVNAFRKINRIDFLLSDKKDLSELNEALPIGYGQTISQPMVVAFMLELLQPKQGEKILDIGAGSGWTTALLAYIVSQKGNPKSQIPNPNDQNSKSMVIAIEIIPELAVFGKNNVAKYNFIKKGIVQFICADASKGLPEQAPFDKILCSAAIHPVRDAASNGARHKELPIAWKKQLKIGGRIVAPIGFSIWLFEKLTENDFKSKEYPGFAFVPLVEKRQR